MTEEIRILEDAGAVEQVKVRKAELAKLTGNKSKEETIPMQEETEGLVIPVSPEEYERAGSNRVTFPPGSKVNAERTLDLECGIPGWDTPGKSIKFPVTVTEDGSDNGKEDKLSAGITTDGVWKLKETYKAITGEDLPIVKNHPNLVPSAVAGKAAVGLWRLQEGHKGGDPTAEMVVYPKLVAILPVGSKVESLT